MAMKNRLFEALLAARAAYAERSVYNNKHSKAIIQMDMNGNKIDEFINAERASKFLGLCRSSIASCCEGRKYYTSCGGFKFKYK